MRGYKEIVDGLAKLEKEVKVLRNLDSSEYMKKFAANSKLVQALAPHWHSFALKFPQLSQSDIDVLFFGAAPPTEKLIKVFQMLYHAAEEVTFKQFVNAFNTTMSIAQLNTKK